MRSSRAPVGRDGLRNPSKVSYPDEGVRVKDASGTAPGATVLLFGMCSPWARSVIVAASAPVPSMAARGLILGPSYGRAFRPMRLIATMRRLIVGRHHVSVGVSGLVMDTTYALPVELSGMYRPPSGLRAGGEPRAALRFALG